MVNAAFYLRPEHNSAEMRVQGHAGFAELGKDPVCAGASICAMQLAQCADLMYEHGKLKKKPTIRVHGGNIRVVVKPKPEYVHDVMQMFWQAEVGFLLLSEAYPAYVSFQPFENGEDRFQIKESSTSRTD